MVFQIREFDHDRLIVVLLWSPVVRGLAGVILPDGDVAHAVNLEDKLDAIAAFLAGRQPKHYPPVYGTGLNYDRRR
jgi:hypothetical protein